MDIDNIFWFNDGKSDKIWGSFRSEDQEYVFWGRRGTKLQFKHHGFTKLFKVHNGVTKLAEQKLNKGYKKIDELQMFTLFPDFNEEVESYFLLAKLGDKVR